MKRFLSGKLFFYLIILSGVVYFFYLILTIPVKGAVGENFPDSIDYRSQSLMTIADGFFAPNAVRWFSPRPFTIPLMYWLVDSDPHRMIFFQKLFYCISVLVFVFAFSNFFKNKYIKVIIFGFLFHFFTWWNIVGWSTVILSECFSMAYMVLWFGTVLLYFYYKTNWSIVLLIVVSVLFSFTRDTWPYFILMFFIFNLLFQFFSLQKKWFVSIALVIFSIGLFLVQSYTVKKGERTRLPLFNSIAGRISQSDEYINWFKKEGMPLTDQLVKDFRGYDLNVNPGKGIIYQRYDDGTYDKLYEWINENGKSTYQKFMLSHLSYFFLKDRTPEQIERIFAYNVQNYYNGPEDYFHNGDNFFPVFNIYYTIGIVIICFLLWFRYRKMIYLFPVILGVLTVFIALITFNADTLEIERHMFIVLILEELIGIISSFIIIDYLLRWLKVKRKMKTEKKVFITT